MASSLEHPVAEAVDVVLRDGGTLRLRPPLSRERDALLGFFEGLSDESRYLRFHGFRRIEPAFVEPLLDPDWSERGALAGWLADRDREERVVAVGSYTRIGGSETAEMAFAVDDSEQGRGIGTRLLEQLAARARDAGINRFVAEVMASNAAALAVFTDAGFELRRTRESGEVELAFPVAATGALASRVEERDHTAVVASLRPFFAPGAVAVIGASRRRGSIGGELFRNILEADFVGAAFPVNLKGEPVAGVRAYTSIGEIEDAVDLAVICLPAEHVLDAASDALRHGVRALCVISAGFAETGEEGRERQDRLLALVRAHGARLVGPNCLGVAVPGRGLNATFAPRALPIGRIGFSSQSGALGLALLEKAAERALGFSSFISIGNKADVSSNDLLEWWEDDEATDLVLLYLESFGNPRTFGRVARRVARSKPILALKAGSTSAGSRAASSHTAALASSDAAVDALFHQAGVLRARTLEELVDAAAVLSTQPLPRGRRVGIITNAGGLGILCADACESAGLELPELTSETRLALATRRPRRGEPRQPCRSPRLSDSGDLRGSRSARPRRPERRRADRDLRASGGRRRRRGRGRDPARRRAERTEEARGGRGDQRGGHARRAACCPSPARPVVALPYPESAARALAFACERSDWLERAPGTTPELDVDSAAARGVVDSALAESPDSWLPPQQIRTLLEAYGIPLVPERIAHTADEAEAAALELGFPAVVKTAVPGVHKTDIGGVALDLRDGAQVRDAVELIGLPVIVQPFLVGGTELLAGAVQDPVFGPLVAFGPGGANAELIGEAGFRIAPLTVLDAQELVLDGKAGRLVAGFRGAAPADAGALVDLLLRLARLVEDIPEIAELDLNPILARPDGCVAVDARIRIAAAHAEPRVKSW